jgi:hypothetical protein
MAFRDTSGEGSELTVQYARLVTKNPQFMIFQKGKRKTEYS